MTFEVNDNGDLTGVASHIFKLGEQTPIILFTGELGAGKTTLIKAIGSLLNIEDQMNSPSFGIINSYNSIDNRKYYHIDLYRLKSPEEAFDIGLFEVLDSGAVCWIEWPDILEKVWQSYDVVNVDISMNNKGLRRIFVSE